MIFKEVCSNILVTKYFVVQWKPLILITDEQRQTYVVHQIKTIIGYFKIVTTMGQMKSNYYKKLKIITVIILSGFHCIIH
jgi:hypothetical protein